MPIHGPAPAQAPPLSPARASPGPLHSSSTSSGNTQGPQPATQHGIPLTPWVVSPTLLVWLPLSLQPCFLPRLPWSPLIVGPAAPPGPSLLLLAPQAPPVCKLVFVVRPGQEQPVSHRVAPALCQMSFPGPSLLTCSCTAPQKIPGSAREHAPPGLCGRLEAWAGVQIHEHPGLWVAFYRRTPGPTCVVCALRSPLKPRRGGCQVWDPLPHRLTTVQS